MKTNKLLLKFIKEAVEDDVKKAAKANAIIDWVDNKIANYNGNTKEIKVYLKWYQFEAKDRCCHQVELYNKKENLTIIFTEKYSGSRAVAAYYPSTRRLWVYGCKIDAKDANPGMFKIAKPILNKIDYKKKELFHELFLHLDFTYQYKGDFKGMKKQDLTNNLSGYFNDPVELNTYFFQDIFPDLLDNIKNNKELIEQSSFSEFFNSVYNKEYFNIFYKNLNDKNKRKIQKRLGTLYLELKNNPEKIKDLAKIDTSNVETKKEEVGWLKKLWNKLTEI